MPQGWLIAVISVYDKKCWGRGGEGLKHKGTGMGAFGHHVLLRVPFGTGAIGCHGSQWVKEFVWTCVLKVCQKRVKWVPCTLSVPVLTTISGNGYCTTATYSRQRRVSHSWSLISIPITHCKVDTSVVPSQYQTMFYDCACFHRPHWKVTRKNLPSYLGGRLKSGPCIFCVECLKGTYKGLII